MKANYIFPRQSAQLNPESLPTVPSGEIVSLGAQKEAEQKRRSQRARERKQQLLEAGGTDREMIPA